MNANTIAKAIETVDGLENSGQYGDRIDCWKFLIDALESFDAPAETLAMLRQAAGL